MELFRAAVYLLCFATSSACAYLLARSYVRTRARLLLWSALCFLFLSANNLAVVTDLLLLPDQNFSLLRVTLSLIAVAVLLYGLVWGAEES